MSAAGSSTTAEHGVSPEVDARATGAWSDVAGIPADLLAAKELVYDPSGFTCSLPVLEAESADYGACEFALDGLSVRFRTARTTPVKAGQFVTVWKRHAGGPIQPFDSEDGVDVLVVGVREGGSRGQFVFPRDVLCERGVFARDGSGGKRAFRVYPPWVTTTSRQAGSSQRWQTNHFLALPAAGTADTGRARSLYHAART
ncbi:MepB family protein [Streptomyces wuyuanensis]|uniref:MepB family protein n=1 Tax=Streptomyces wuyuanensis TaxID=1196353 RepID=UPI00371D4A7D